MLKGGLYLAAGDSWVWAASTTLTKGAHFYATQIRNLIRANNGVCRLLNKGIGGNTSTEMLTNVPWIFSQNADLITINIGMNDCAGGAISVATYTTTLGSIVDAAKILNPGAHIILCTPGRTTDANRTPYIADYRTACAAVATAKSVDVCLFENAWLEANDAANLEADGIHPNATGHLALSALLWTVVETGEWLNRLQK